MTTNDDLMIHFKTRHGIGYLFENKKSETRSPGFRLSICVKIEYFG